MNFLKRYTGIIPMSLWGILMFVIGFNIGDRITINKKEIEKPTISSEIILNNSLCSYCGEDKYVAIRFPHKNIIICEDCLILTFDLMLGRNDRGNK